MKFVFLKNEEYGEIYAALVKPEVANWVQKLSDIFVGMIERRSTPDRKITIHDIHHLGGYGELQDIIFDGILSCAILEKPEDSESICYDSYELNRWASKRRGMGKILLLRIMDQGVSIIADRNDISPQAMGSIKQIKDKFSHMFMIDPLDNKDKPLTNLPDDDCETYNHDGGYEYLERDYYTDTGGYYISKLDDKATGEYTDEELLDFAIEQKNYKKLPPDVTYKSIVDDVKKQFPDNYPKRYIVSGVQKDFETVIRDVFDDIYHETSGGTIRRESVIKLTKGQLTKIIRESILNKLFL